MLAINDSLAARPFVGSNRLAWVDTAKFLGIFAIYIGHVDPVGGRVRQFVFLYHVPFFFLLAGMFALSSLKYTLIQNIKKKIFSILIPYFGFCLMNILVIVIDQDVTKANLYTMLKQALYGIRNQIFANSLWFLPCLFIVYIGYDILTRALAKYTSNHTVILLIISFLLYLIMGVIGPSAPSWFFNLDSAMSYLVYFSLGAFIFPFIQDFKLLNQKTFVKIVNIGLCISTFAFAALMLFKGPNYLLAYLNLALPLFGQLLYSFMITCILIFANLIIAKYFLRISLFTSMGKDTLINCGTEQIANFFALKIFLIYGSTFVISNTYALAFYTLALLIISHFTIVAFINKYLVVFSGQYRVNKQIQKNV